MCGCFINPHISPMVLSSLTDPDLVAGSVIFYACLCR